MTTAEAPAFVPPQLQDNKEGWGPVEVAAEFKEIPYQPFSKADRLGKISDWTGQGIYGERRYNNRYQQFGMGGAYNYYHDEDEDTFKVVDAKQSTQKSNKYSGNRRFLRGQRSYKDSPRTRNQSMQQLSKGQQPPRSKKNQWSNRRWNSNPRRGRQEERTRDASVDVKASWTIIEEIELSRLSKLSLPVPEPTDLKQCGRVEYYDKSFDKCTTKLTKRVEPTERLFHNVSTTDDPEIRGMLSEGNVFATDAILAAIMCAPRSVYSWDLVIERVADKVFLDKRPSRDDINSFDLLTVNETSADPPKESAEEGQSQDNTVAALAQEATYINQNVSQQLVKPKPAHKYKNPNPFAEQGDDVASVGYKYRKFSLGQGVDLVCRTEVNAVMKGADGKKQFLNVRALNEFDPKQTQFMRKLDSQRGAVLATELKNNSYKLAKWTMSSLLASADQIKLAYVTRADQRDRTKHVILGTQYFRPKELATQINLNVPNAFGILRCIVDICLANPPGKYCLLKDPNKPVLRLYSVPQDTFDSSDSESDDENPFGATLDTEQSNEV